MIELRDVEVNFGEIRALCLKGRHSFPEKSVVAVLGSNGAGKTTLVNAMLGESAYSGSIEGIDPRRTSVQFQTNSYNALMRVGELCRLVGVRMESSALAGSFNIMQLSKKRIGTLSGGERQRMTLFLVLSLDEPIYLFDELTTGLDFQTRSSLMEVVRARTAGSTVFVTTHYFEEVEGWASHCLILHEGLALYSGTIGEFLGRRPHHSLIKVRGDAFSDGELLGRSVVVPWEGGGRYLVAKDAADQAGLAERLSRQQVPFEVQPCGLYSSYMLALSAVSAASEGGRR